MRHFETEPLRPNDDATLIRKPRPCNLIQVFLEGDLTRSWPDLIALIAVGITLPMAIFAFASFFSGLGSPFSLLFALPLAPVSAFLVCRFWWARKAVRARLRNLPDVISGVVQRVVQDIKGIGALSGLKELVRILLEKEHEGVTIRIRNGRDADSIDPISLPFEPQALDETLLPNPHDLAFTQSQQHLGPETGAIISHANQSEWRRYIRRNVVLGGGWLLFIGLCFNTITSGLEAMQRKRLTLTLFCNLACLLILLAVPRHLGLLRKRQWLSVPAGLVLRQAGWRQERWKVHLFARHRSVLLVGRFYRGSWAAFVADGEACEWAYLTKVEIEFLLRAWLSPRPPPSPDGLADLT